MTRLIVAAGGGGDAALYGDEDRAVLLTYAWDRLQNAGQIASLDGVIGSPDLRTTGNTLHRFRLPVQTIALGLVTLAVVFGSSMVPGICLTDQQGSRGAGSGRPAATSVTIRPTTPEQQDQPSLLCIYPPYMVDIELPPALIALQLSVYAARLRVVEHVRAHGPIGGWSPEVDAEGARLQQALEAGEDALRRAIEESGLEREHGRRAVRRALMAAAAPQMSDRPGITTTPDST